MSPITLYLLGFTPVIIGVIITAVLKIGDPRHAKRKIDYGMGKKPEFLDTMKEDDEDVDSFLVDMHARKKRADEGTIWERNDKKY